MTRPYVPLFQERWRRRPFWMLVGCILVNRTRWAQARPVHAALVRDYRTAAGLADADVGLIQRAVDPLGLSTIRALSLVRLAREWRRYGGGWHRRHLRRPDVLRLPGCGDYAADSWSIFIEGRLYRRPTDRRLREYLAQHPNFKEKL